MIIDGSNVLDGSVNSNIVITNVTLAQRAALANLVVGMMVYVTDGAKPGLYVWAGTEWKQAGRDLLDGNDKILSTYIPDAVLGQLEYQGAWDFATNLSAASAANKGHYYIASNATTQNGYVMGDWAVSNGTSWDKIDNTDAVQSVAGRTGAVTLTGADLGTNPTFSGTVNDTLGKMRSIPVSTQTGNLKAADNGTLRIITGALTIDTATAFAAGDTCLIYNNSASSVTITLTSLTTYISGINTNKTSLTLTTRGVVSVLCVASNTYVVSGDVS